MSDYLTPNVSINLASSYNERGINGYTTTITNAVDQRKINCFYETVKNSVSGGAVTYLTKRPGILDSGNTLLTTGVPYLYVSDPTQASNGWCIELVGTAVKSTNESFSQTVISDGNVWYPTYIDTTSVSGTPTVVLQIRRSTGGTLNKVYYATTIVSSNWTAISDSDFTGLTIVGKMEHLDGFALQLASDNYLYNSDLNSLSSWDPNSRIRKNIQQDVPLGLAKLGSQILAFGYNTVEVFVNAGNPSGSPLVTVPSLATDMGLSAAGATAVASFRHYYAVLAHRLYFVGHSGAGKTVQVFNGSAFEKVSTTAIDRILSGANITHVQTLSFFGNEAVSFNFSLVGDTTQRWMMFFPSINEWFEWTSAAYQPVGNGIQLIGAPGFETKYGHFDISGAQTAGWVDGTSTAFTMTTQFMLPKDSSGRKAMSWAGVLADTAASTSNLAVSFSDDDYATFSAARNIDLASTDKTLFRCGTYRNRAVRLAHSANLECRIEKFLARIG